MVSNNIAPTLIVIMGALGDLSRRKLIPALYQLSTKGMFGPEHLILGVDINKEMDDHGFKALVQQIISDIGPATGSESLPDWCERCLAYQPLPVASTEGHTGLAARIIALEQEHNLPGNRVFYLAIPISALGEAVTELGKAGLNRSSGWTRLVLEKPFGTDLLSHQNLDKQVHKYFKEEQLFRIDHYLGKETVQNLFAFRFANTIFEQVWNRQNIESVQITVAESAGIEGRSTYYEQTGAVRDMIQNHLTQLLTLVAMEVPSSFEAESIRLEKIKVLREILPVRPESVILGQYESGEINGKRVIGYREEPGVSPSSDTETFVALKLEVANWRWRGVPFYLRTGKRMSRRRTQIVISFQCVPFSIFDTIQEKCQIHPNVLVATLQPDEGFDLHVQVKALGEPFKLTTQRFTFRYADVFGPVADAYETLLLDILKGNLSLFVSDEEAEYSWRLYDDILKQKIPVYRYKAGTDGPAELDRLGIGTSLVD